MAGRPRIHPEPQFTFTITVDQSMNLAMRQRAAAEDRSVNNFVKHAIRLALKSDRPILTELLPTE